jgi:Arc/MetJ family transcription regulator
MRTMLSIDDRLLADAHELSGIDEVDVLVHEALRSLVEREAARRLVLLGGSAPDFVAPPRRRAPVFKEPVR